jgi:hypothetical protein
MLFHRCAYWGNWSRILSRKDGWTVELDLTPVGGLNSTSKHEWAEIASTHIRRHCTAPAHNDINATILPAQAFQAMYDNLPLQIVRYLLTVPDDELLSTIDWDKFNKIQNGGAILSQCKK